jgi:hypothetical protein
MFGKSHEGAGVGVDAAQTALSAGKHAFINTKNSSYSIEKKDCGSMVAFDMTYEPGAD